MSATPASHFAGLDPLRLAAALVVLGFHALETADWSGGLWSHGGWGLLRAGWVGVDVFFVISGLVIGSSAMRGVDRGGAWRTGYWRRRLARIVPLYLLTSVVFLLAVDASAVTGPGGIRQALSHLFFVHNLWPETLATINPPSWSLANEMQFYLLAMLAAPWLVRLPPLALALGLWLFALLWRVLAWRFALGQGVDDAGTLNWLSTLAPGMLDSFGLGLALAAARRRGLAAPHGLVRWYMLAAALLALGTLATVTEAVARGTHWQTPVIALGLHSWAALAAAALVWAVHDLQPSARMRSAWTWAGQLSYGVYLWHAIVLFLLLAHTSLRGPALLAATLGPTLLLAILGWVMLERPVLRRAGAEGAAGGAAQSIGSSSVNTVWPGRER